ncbi:hypothetical protein IHQ71_12070 [Rhizobium sp. TH2]|uniref:hypothetical protein n=1 Tax=Rhizobium sp. TH2 TaxID=2775403 RepID=UPI00215752DD|nr:hypothetical protein [Rhizobium sp. TH2]UVC11241.1 hypothetical protein IHQ71_12070 [Rhizobium sp. TH2]
MTDKEITVLLFIAGFCVLVAVIGIVFQDRLPANFESGPDGGDSDGGGDGGGD